MKTINQARVLFSSVIEDKVFFWNLNFSQEQLNSSQFFVQQNESSTLLNFWSENELFLLLRNKLCFFISLKRKDPEFRRVKIFLMIINFCVSFSSRIWWSVPKKEIWTANYFWLFYSFSSPWFRGPKRFALSQKRVLLFTLNEENERRKKIRFFFQRETKILKKIHIIWKRNFTIFFRNFVVFQKI